MTANGNVRIGELGSYDTIHPARLISYDELSEGLEASRRHGHLYARDSGDGRRLYCYTAACVYDGAWNDFTRLARGLILLPAERRILATPFPKFHNFGEPGTVLPELPFEVTEKYDGSLIVLHHHDGAWRAATKGSFDSWQARWSEAEMAGRNTDHLDKSATYLLEAIHPDNRIVVHYDNPGFYLLAAYDGTGRELGMAELEAAAHPAGWLMAERHSFDSIEELIRTTGGLTAQSEGFVVRFADGYRLKFKGAEYRRIHALISNCTPIALWEAMRAGDDLDRLRRDIPEEFWADFDRIRSLLDARFAEVENRLRIAADACAHLDDKALGLSIKTLDPLMQRLIFPYRRTGSIPESGRQVVFRHIRPTGNRLPGYVPSHAMERLAEEAA